MSDNPPNFKLNRRTMIGRDTQMSIAMISAVLTATGCYLGLEVAFQTGLFPETTTTGYIGLFIVGIILGTVVVYRTANHKLSPILKGGALGSSLFAIVVSLVILFSQASLIGDDGVIAIVVITLFSLATVQAYMNRGALVSCLIIFLPPFGFLFIFFYQHGGAFNQEFGIGEALVRSAMFTLPIGIVGGMAAFMFGLLIWKIRPLSELG